MTALDLHYFSPLAKVSGDILEVLHPLIRWHLAGRGVLVREALEKQLSLADGTKETAENLFLSEVVDEMKKENVFISIPLYFKNKLVGLFNLGAKRSGDMYTREDLELLATLAGHAAIAIENAKLYEEISAVKNYNEDLLESLTNGVIAVDMEGIILTFNVKASHLVGLLPADVIGRPIQQIFSKENKVIADILLQTLRKKSTFLSFQTTFSQNGNLVPVTIGTTVLQDAAGREMGAVAVLHDMSEVKALEEKVRQSDKLAAMGTMAAGMAHEIKNPLASMKVLAQLMSKKFDDDVYRHKFVEIMPREIDRIDKIVEGLLGLARSTAPRFQLVKLNELIEEVLMLIEDQVQKSKIKVTKVLGMIPDLEADVQQINQIIMNLLLNAVHAMPEGGELTLATSFEKQAHLPLRERGGSYIEQTDAVVMKIRDTGEGISAENMKRLFTPFFTTRYGGTGLGLAVTHRIIDEHRGNIDVESRVGEGTTFIVWLPLKQFVT